jgi:multidrug resistance efflux pump
MPSTPISNNNLDDILKETKIVRGNPHDQIYSNEVREIISHKPVWIVRNGIGLFFIIFLSLFIFCFFIHYPDIVKAPVRIVGENLPKQIVSRTESKIVDLKAKQNATVNQGDVLAVLYSSADYNEILVFESWIKRVEKKDTLKNFKIPALPQLLNLGDLQKNYQEIALKMYQLGWSEPNGYLVQKIQAIEQDVELIEALKRNGTQQKELIEQDLALQEKMLTVNELMVREKAMAPLDINKDKSVVISKKQQLLQTNVNKLNHDASLIAKTKELFEIAKERNDIIQNFKTALYNAKSALADWRTNFLIIAPETGKVQFSSYFQENSWIRQGQELFYIIPSQTNLFAEVMAPQQNFGKIMQGQQVNISLNSFPRNEFGVLKGTINYIPIVPYKDSAFLLKVQLTNGLITSFNKKLPFTNSLSGTAEIITEDASLIERLLYQWRGLWRR